MACLKSRPLVGRNRGCQERIEVFQGVLPCGFGMSDPANLAARIELYQWLGSDECNEFRPSRSRLDDVIERIRRGNALAEGPEASVNSHDLDPLVRPADPRADSPSSRGSYEHFQGVPVSDNRP